MSAPSTTPKTRNTASGLLAGLLAAAALAAGSGAGAAETAFAATGCDTAKSRKDGYDARLVGTNANDCLKGGPRQDRIKGLGGRDLMDGSKGGDRIVARDGFRDLVHCGGGDDIVLADPKDVLSGCETDRVGEVAPPSGDGPDNPGCAVDPATMAAVDCELIKRDTAEVADAERLWGSSSCVNDSRVQRLTGGGDTHTTAMGSAPTEDFYRQLTVFDGDDFHGERCELAKNEHRHGDEGGDGTFQIYEEGQHRITFLSVKLPNSLPLTTTRWQTILQMKQTQPAAAGGGMPIIELQLRNGKFYLDSPDGSYWSTPARAGTWTRIALDVDYSQDPSQGSIAMYVDANGDGDALDAGEQSPVTQTATLKREEAGGDSDDGIAPGESIPSHLRTGVYHDTSIACPTGCSIELDNVEVVK